MGWEINSSPQLSAGPPFKIPRVHRTCTDIKYELDDRADVGVTFHQLGIVAEERGRLTEAEEWYRKAVSIDEELGDRASVAISFHQLGVVAQTRGRLAEAEEWYREALTINEELGDQPGMALSYGQMGLLAEARNRPAEALDWTIRCVTVFADFPHPQAGPGPSHLARLTLELGLDVLDNRWHALTNSPVPPVVHNYILSQQEKADGIGWPD